MIPRQYRLKHMKDFEILFKEGRFVNADFVTVKIWKTEPDKYPRRKYNLEDLKIGFVVGKKVSKSAVKRNRIRRQMREVVRLLLKDEKLKSGFMLALIAKPLILGKKYEEINKELNIVRFKNKKSEYLIYAREKFYKNKNLSLKEELNQFKDVHEKRDWLVNEIKGYGLKEASHFLRNIGFGDNIAILDRHVLRNMKLLNIIDKIPASISRKRYLEIEDRLRLFSREINIPVDHLDFVLWYKETGEVFK